MISTRLPTQEFQLNATKPLIILPGMLFLDEGKNSYLIVSGRNGETVTYVGQGFKGMMEDEIFIDRFLPVDPTDVSQAELDGLVALTHPARDITPRIGFIKD
jgi:hypothetical protein